MVTLREDWVKRSELSQIMCALSLPHAVLRVVSNNEKNGGWACLDIKNPNCFLGGLVYNSRIFFVLIKLQWDILFEIKVKV